ARRCLRESSPTLEFLAAQRGDRSPEFTGKIGKEVERAPFAPFLAHKQQWNVRAEQQERSEKIDRARIHERGQPLAKRPVADLVVVLQKVDERAGRQARTRLAAAVAATVRRALALIGIALGQRAG